MHTIKIQDAYDYDDSRGQTAYDQRSPTRLPPPMQDDYEGECGEENFIDDEAQKSTFDERESSRLSGTTRASDAQPKPTKEENKPSKVHECDDHHLKNDQNNQEQSTCTTRQSTRSMHRHHR
eukprot:1088583-Amphidinium_carterae.1